MNKVPLLSSGSLPCGLRTPVCRSVPGVVRRPEDCGEGGFSCLSTLGIVTEESSTRPRRLSPYPEKPRNSVRASGREGWERGGGTRRHPVGPVSSEKGGESTNRETSFGSSCTTC